MLTDQERDLIQSFLAQAMIRVESAIETSEKMVAISPGNPQCEGVRRHWLSTESAIKWLWSYIDSHHPWIDDVRSKYQHMKG